MENDVSALINSKLWLEIKRLVERWWWQWLVVNPEISSQIVI